MFVVFVVLVATLLPSDQIAVLVDKIVVTVPKRVPLFAKFQQFTNATVFELLQHVAPIKLVFGTLVWFDAPYKLYIGRFDTMHQITQLRTKLQRNSTPDFFVRTAIPTIPTIPTTPTTPTFNAREQIRHSRVFFFSFFCKKISKKGKGGRSHQTHQSWFHAVSIFVHEITVVVNHGPGKMTHDERRASIYWVKFHHTVWCCTMGPVCFFYFMKPRCTRPFWNSHLFRQHPQQTRGFPVQQGRDSRKSGHRTVGVDMNAFLPVHTQLIHENHVQVMFVQFFVGVIDAKLFKRIVFKNFKPKDIQQPHHCCRGFFFTTALFTIAVAAHYVYVTHTCGIDSMHNPSKQFTVHFFRQRFAIFIGSCSKYTAVGSRQ